MTAADCHKAAQLLRTLATAEHARILGDPEELRRIMDAVDPIDCMALAAVLEVEGICRAQGVERRAVR